MSGIQVDGLDSLPLGRGKFARFFQVRRKGVGEYEILSRTVTTGIYRFTQTIESKMMMTGQAKHVHGSYWSG